jgi:hypothetical protein
MRTILLAGLLTAGCSTSEAPVTDIVDRPAEDRAYAGEADRNPSWAPTIRTMSPDDYRAFEAMPHFANAMFSFAGHVTHGTVMLHVMRDSAELEIHATNGGSGVQVVARLPMTHDDLAELVSGGALDLRVPPEADLAPVFHASNDGEQFGAPVAGSLTVDAQGRFVVRFDLSDGVLVYGVGTLRPSCEFIEGSRALHVVDYRDVPDCDRLLSWL